MEQILPKRPRKNTKPKTVLEVLGYDPNRVWYPIDVRLKGYEVSNDGYVRSLKSHRNEYGCLMRPRDGLFNLVDNDGHQIRFTIEEIEYLAMNNPFKDQRKTSEIASAGRNKRAFQVRDEDYEKEIKNQPHVSRFTIVKDSNEDNSKKKEVICPIYQIPREGY